VDVEDRVDVEGRGSHTSGHIGGRGATRGGRGGPRERGDRSVVYCYYCKEPGHTKY